MVHFKSCPKCKGDLVEEVDRFDKYSSCAQCGFTKEEADQDALVALMEEIPAVKRPGRPAGHRRYVNASGR